MDFGPGRFWVYEVRVGGVAQLGERLVCNQEVIGSIPFTSTRYHRGWLIGHDSRHDRSVVGYVRGHFFDNCIFVKLL